MSKISNLPQVTSLDPNDLMYAVDVSVGVNGGSKILVSDVKTSLKQTPAEIKTSYESNPNTNAYTDVDKALVATVSGKVSKSGDTMSGNLDMGTHKVTNLPTPTSDSDAATKFYIDDRADNYNWKQTIASNLLSSPPASPAVGSYYIVAAPSAGIWFGHDYQITTWNGSIWKYIIPKNGDVVHVLSDNRYYDYSSATNWTYLEKNLDHGQLQNLTTDVHTQYLLTNGTRSMSGVLNMGTNNITNAGTINTVNIATHGSRHNPGGVDAITTAAAVSISASTASAEGTAGSVARSDHTHQILTGNVSSQTADSGNSAGSSANLARADHNHNIATAVPVPTGTANAQGSASTFAKSDHVHNTVISNTSALSVTTDTTVSLTDVLILGMTVTPPAGTYLAHFASSSLNSGNGAERNYISIYSANAQIPSSEVRLGTAGAAAVPVATQAIVTVNGSQAVEVRWRVIAGTGTMYQRSLILIKLS